MRYTPHSLTTIHASFCVYLKLKGYRTGNGRMYNVATKEFIEFCMKEGAISVDQLNTELLKSYAAHLGTRPNKRGGVLAANTIKHHLFGIRLFFDFLLNCEYLDSVPTVPSMIVSLHNERQALSIEDMHLLYENCTNYRTRAILSLAYGCGLRRNEIHMLNVNDVHFRDRYIIIKSGKNAKRREVPMSSEVRKDISRYVRRERPNQLNKKHYSRSLLLNEHGGRMSGNQIYLTFKKLAHKTQSELSVVSPTLHHLRHSIACHLMDNGAGIEFIKDFLGHTLIDTAQLYAIKQKRKL